MTRSEFHHQVIDVLLGEADERTTQEIRTYIELGDDDTIRLARDAQRSLRHLLQALEPCEARDELRFELLERIEVPADTAMRIDDDSSARFTNSTSGDAPRRRVSLPASIAAVIALVVIAVVAFYSVRQGIHSQRSNRLAQSPMQTSPANDATGPTQVSDLASMMQSYFDLIPLHGQTADADGTDRLLINRRHNLCFVFAPVLLTDTKNGLYDLRITSGKSDEPFVAGQFSVDSTGWSLFRIELPQDPEFTMARASVVRTGSDDSESEGIEEILVGNFSQ